MADIDGNALASSGLESRMRLMYDANIRTTKQMNILPCLEDSVHTLSRSSPRVRIIESQAFCNQTSLESVTLPEDLEEIHNSSLIL